MEYGKLIKRAWEITWRFKALWVLGIFAGITGCQASGGSGGGSGSGNTPFTGPGGQLSPEFSAFRDGVMSYLPVIIAGGLLLVLLGIIWSLFGIAARGGLVVGVDQIETGASPKLGALWAAGWSRFWTLVGIDILLALPVFATALLIAVLVAAPLIGWFAGGAEPGPEVLVPICGSLGLGVPILILMAFALGIMHPLAIRYAMLGGQGVFEASGNAWRFLRARIKDTLVFWLISGLLNFAASFVFAIPVIAVSIGAGVGIGVAALSDQWGMAIAGGGVLLIIIVLLSIVYTGVWGTYSSALWTLFFRQVTGMATPAAAPAPATAQYPANPPMAPAQPTDV